MSFSVPLHKYIGALYGILNLVGHGCLKAMCFYWLWDGPLFISVVTDKTVSWDWIGCSTVLAIMPSHQQNTHDFADGRKNMNDIFNNYVCSASHMRSPLFRTLFSKCLVRALFQYMHSTCHSHCHHRNPYIFCVLLRYTVVSKINSTRGPLISVHAGPECISGESINITVFYHANQSLQHLESMEKG